MRYFPLGISPGAIQGITALGENLSSLSTKPLVLLNRISSRSRCWPTGIGAPHLWLRADEKEEHNLRGILGID